MEIYMKKVITYGTFDLLHVGHINLLRRARELGDYLVVAISTDEFNAIKNKKAYYSFEDRKQILEAVKYVDKVIPENTWEQKIKDVTENNIDIFVMGHDWEGKFDFLKDYCEVIYLPRTEGISTTKIKSDLGLKQPD
jgi:glycerol-3-phosphate cytidylyltransferase